MGTLTPERGQVWTRMGFEAVIRAVGPKQVTYEYNVHPFGSLLPNYVTHRMPVTEFVAKWKPEPSRSGSEA